MFGKSKSNFNSNTANAKTLHKSLEFTAVEQYKLLRTNLSFTLPEDEKCSIIGVTSAMRGDGKSTTAVNLSYVLAESGKKALLIDGDLRIPSIAKKMRIDGSVGLTDLLRGGVILDEEAVLGDFEKDSEIETDKMSDTEIIED